jgi:hypothetical protein
MLFVPASTELPVSRLLTAVSKIDWVPKDSLKKISVKAFLGLGDLPEDIAKAILKEHSG